MSNKDQYNREREQLEQFLCEVAEMLERTSGFVQRRSKIGGKELVQILSLGALEQGDATLEAFCQVASDLGIKLSASGLHQRMTMEAVELLRQVCQLWMGRRGDEATGRDVLVGFDAVRIVDSSRIHLPESMADFFPGTRNGATMKVQLAYEYHSGRIEALELESGRSPDQNCDLAQTLSKAGDLVLFDLGYFSQKRFAQLDADGVYFLSRLQSQVGLYQSNKAPLAHDLLKDLNQLPQDIKQGEEHFLMGSSKRVPVRVIYYRVPPKIAQERRRKAKQQARKNGTTCTQRSLDWLDWLIFVTNAPDHLLSVDQIATVYRLRWQIEIIFKVWKQEMDWALIGNWRPARILCQFYARCLALLLFHCLQEKYQAQFDWEISWQKAIRLLKRKTTVLIKIVRHHFRGLLTFLKQLDRDFRRSARKTRRQSSLSTYQLLKLVLA